MKDDIKTLVRDTVKQELVLDHGSHKHGSSYKHDHAAAAVAAAAAASDPSIHMQHQWAKKIESMISEKVEELRSELFALRYAESADSSSNVHKEDSRSFHSKTFPTEHHHPPQREINDRKSIARFGNHNTHNTQSGSVRSFRPSVYQPHQPHPPSQSIPSRATVHHKPSLVRPQPMPDESGPDNGSMHSDSLDHNSSR